MTTDYGPTVADKIFKFNLKLVKEEVAGNANIPGAVIPPATNFPAAGDEITLTIPAGQTNATKDFSEIRFDKAGTYTFTATELASGEEGITDDTIVWTLTVVIEDLDGKLSVKSTEYKPGTEDDDHKTNKDTAKYTNPYKPAPTYYQPKVEKFITVDYGPIVAEKIFTFELKLTNEDVQGNPDIPGTNFPTTGEQVSVTIPAGETTASAVFSNIRFDKAGTFTFTVTELTSGEEGITDDTVVWTLTVKVVDDDGALRVESTEYVPSTEDDDHATNADKATFTNPYKPEPVDAEIVGQKVIDGETQEDMEFTFTLVPVSMTIPVEAEATLTEIPMPAVDTVTVSGAAPFTFGLINYEVAGVYTYKVFEQVDDYVGYTFDDSIYDVTVTITDMDGYLDQKVEYALDGKAAKLALFTNLFETASLTVTKTVTTVVVNGDTLYEFTVELFDENGDPLYGVYPITGSVKGNVVNGKATFSLAHNQNAVISDIPIGASYKVTEKLDEETYTTTFVNPDGTIEREGNISNWYNKPKSVVPNLGGLWINVGDCFE